MPNTASRLAIVALAAASLGQSAPRNNSFDAGRVWTFESLTDLKVVNGTAEIVTYRGRRALHLIPPADPQASADSITAILAESDFANGTIEAEVAGAPRTGAPDTARGFIGVAFRVQTDESRYENMYLRPTNGRADDQVRRNHSVQYTSEPDFPWPRLRKENPEQYESYVDLEPGAWTQMKISVSNLRAQLFVNGAAQPCLTVNDLKLGNTHGRIALWAHMTTDGYFSRVTVRRQ